MGGEGCMASANHSLKQNRALLRKRKYREVKNLYLKSSGKTELEFKKISPEQLAIIKRKIRIRHKERVRNEIIVSIILIILTCGIFYFLSQ
jgi:hypothetical protein